MEADFQQYYGLDIAKVEPQKAARLLFQLPYSCRVFVEIHPSNQWGWTESLLNKSANILDSIMWQNGNAGKKKSKQSPKPEPFIPSFLKPESEISKGTQSHTTEEIERILSLPRG